MRITLKELNIQNFKGIKSKSINFSNKTAIRGMNASGKTTIVDAFLWLLFGKNSQYVEKFDLRPLDENGKPINFIDISVSAVLDIDGKEVELGKIQSQNWVKQRGSEQSVFQGNINKFEIDGYPKSDKEYKAFISEIVDENLFKMLTNPTYFPNLEWKEQRDILMRFATDKSDYDLAVEFGCFADLLDELQKAPSTEDINKKYAKSLKELKATQTEIPVRIDELSKQIVDIDVAELELKKNEIKEQLTKAGLGKEALENLKSEVFNLKMEISNYERIANESVKNDRHEAEMRLINAKDDYRKAENAWCKADSEIASYKYKVEYNTRLSAELGTEYATEKAKTFDESKTICPMCGQNLPTDKVETLKRDFETKKKEILENIKRKGFELKDIIDKANAEIELRKSELQTNKDNMNDIAKRIEVLEKTLKTLPEHADLSTDVKYNEMVHKETELNSKIAELSAQGANDYTTPLEIELKEIESELAKVANNTAIEERIDELKTEQRSVAQKIADCEKMLYLVETFTRMKLDNISTSINSHFNGVNFVLFKQNINGSIEETCECSVNGVRYSDVNSGHKIIAGLEIIRTLSALYDTYSVLFIDNAESINSFNLPKMDCQTVLLKVSDDKELVIDNNE